MKKLLLWLLMVLLLVALILGGFAGGMYATTNEESLPEPAATMGDIALEPIGYSWTVPIFRGILSKEFYSAPNLTVQNLGDFVDEAPTLVLPEWVGTAKITLVAPDGSTAYTGDAAGLAAFVYTQNGGYELQLELQSALPHNDEVQPQGWYRYCARYTYTQKPKVAFSTDTAAQGSIVAVTVTGILEKDAVPTAETDLGTVWFAPLAGGGWMGYIPVTYNAEAGSHTIALQCGEETFDATLSVTKGASTMVNLGPAQEIPAGAETEYRNAVWPLYTTGDAPKAWKGSFQAPVEAAVQVAYGAMQMREGASAGRATGMTYQAAPGAVIKAPAAGTVVYAGVLALTGGTVVIDHGCGVKSYLYGLEGITVANGQGMEAGQEIATAGAAQQLIYELRIGSKTVDPAAAIRGVSGLQYKENLYFQ